MDRRGHGAHSLVCLVNTDGRLHCVQWIDVRLDGHIGQRAHTKVGHTLCKFLSCQGENCTIPPLTQAVFTEESAIVLSWGKSSPLGEDGDYR